MTRFKQLTEAARFMIIALCATLILTSCDKKESEEPKPVGDLSWKIFYDGILIISGTGKIPDYSSSIDARFYPVGLISAIKAVVIEDGITYVGDYAFAFCNNLTSVTIGNSVTAIGSRAFDYCQLLTEVTIGNSVTSIGESAFSNCSSLTEVTIPNSVTFIESSAFESCLRLTAINVDSDNNTFSSENGILFNKAKTKLVQYPAGKTDTSYIIPGSVESVESNAFRFCQGLTSVTFPNSVTTIESWAFEHSWLKSVNVGNSVTYIGNYAFSSCRDLTSVIIGNSVESIESHTFANCHSLTGCLTIPNSVTTIGNDAFTSCSSLTEVTIPNSVVSIGNGAFNNCSGLTKLTIGNSVESIGDYAFGGCVSLTGTLTIPNSIKSIGRAAFNGCSSLTSVTIPSFVEFIGYLPFANCGDLMSITVDVANSVYCSDNGVLFDKAKTILIQYPGGKTGAYTIPNSVESIGDVSFGGCGDLTEVTIPNSVASIGNQAFAGCSVLTTVNFNAVNCGAMGYEGRWQVYAAFPYDCSNLTTINIGNEVKTIPDYAFYYCSGLTEFTNYAAMPQTIGNGAFNGENIITCTLRVPSASVAAYKAATGWKDFVNIVALE